VRFLSDRPKPVKRDFRGRAILTWTHVFDGFLPPFQADNSNRDIKEKLEVITKGKRAGQLRAHEAET
jgi:hypothetical protein